MNHYSVTEVLSTYQDFRGIPEDTLEMAAQRGTVVHNACAAYVLGLFVPHLSDDCRWYFESFVRWFDRYVRKVIMVEKQLTDEGFGFTGRPDLVCIMEDSRLMVTDLKTPVTERPTWKIQLSSYRHLVTKYLQAKAMVKGDQAPFCQSLRLRSDGQTARAIPYQYSDDDFSIFLQCLNVHRYLELSNGR